MPPRDAIHQCIEDTGNWVVVYSLEADAWMLKNDFLNIAIGPISYCPYCGDWLDADEEDEDTPPLTGEHLIG